MLLNVDSDSNGQRLDNFLVKMVKNIPKSRIYRMVRTGEVRVNSRRVRVFTKVYQGDSKGASLVRYDNREFTARL